MPGKKQRRFPYLSGRDGTFKRPKAAKKVVKGPRRGKYYMRKGKKVYLKRIYHPQI